jgi:hypothetical protein
VGMIPNCNRNTSSIVRECYMTDNYVSGKFLAACTLFAFEQRVSTFDSATWEYCNPPGLNASVNRTSKQGSDGREETLTMLTVTSTVCLPMK